MTEKKAIDRRGWVVFSNERSIAVQFDEWDEKTSATLAELLARHQVAA